MDIFNRVKLESDLKLCEELKRKIISGEIPSVIANSLMREFDPVIKTSENYGGKFLQLFKPDEFDRFLFDQTKMQDFSIKELVPLETEAGARVSLSSLFTGTDLTKNDFFANCLVFNQLLATKERGPRFYIHNLNGKKIVALKGACPVLNPLNQYC